MPKMIVTIPDTEVAQKNLKKKYVTEQVRNLLVAILAIAGSAIQIEWEE